MKHANINSSRPQKVESKIRTLVAEILRDLYGDIVITIVDAKSSGGLQFVKLFYYAPAGNSEAMQKRLDGITGAVRYELAARMNQRYTPDLRFVYDDTLERAARIEELLK
ncbi:MAG: ribosome-binding factor A [Rickettsiales bacterium]|jgi:ribosome-binding factor A|nr:ribosome-binding factor A [Rickettsiales bacterium]